MRTLVCFVSKILIIYLYCYYKFFSKTHSIFRQQRFKNRLLILQIFCFAHNANLAFEILVVFIEVFCVLVDLSYFNQRLFIFFFYFFDVVLIEIVITHNSKVLFAFTFLTFVLFFYFILFMY